MITRQTHDQAPSARVPFNWALALAIVPAGMALVLPLVDVPAYVVIGGLLIFGVLFAINSSLHSYLIVSFAKEDGVSLDVGFYYMSNACGRLLGTVLSGWLFQAFGLMHCLWVSAMLLLSAAVISLALPSHHAASAQPTVSLPD